MKKLLRTGKTMPNITLKQASIAIGSVAAFLAAVTAIWQSEVRPALSYELRALQAEFESVQCDWLYMEYLRLKEQEAKYAQSGEQTPDWLKQLLTVNHHQKQKYNCTYE